MSLEILIRAAWARRTHFFIFNAYHIFSVVDIDEIILDNILDEKEIIIIIINIIIYNNIIINI